MKSTNEVFDQIASQGQDHYDIVAAVMFKHVPVVTGIVGMFLVLIAGLSWDWYKKRQLRGRTDLHIAPPTDEHPLVVQARRDAEEDTAFAALLARLDADIAAAGSDPAKWFPLDERVDAIGRRPVKAKAALALADGYRAAGSFENAERCYLTAVHFGKREAQRVSAEAAERLSTLYEERSEKGKALTLARKALILFEDAQAPDKVATAALRVKQLRA